ncbi:olfactory receptor 14A16-like [Gopherus flavomarginatus]|uniref:olfactory receptor 14A16-like n=1 Tax=Gopherus flavomarginatus TaxID=286002 RepID=UPI0021CC44F1|nr:olfactory receptor 14A16-like [Gopherus flavomarginatus]
MSNRTSMTEFLLLGFSEVRELQILHFLLFLGIYLVALTGNILVITLVVLDSHLHTPMYFFLVNLSIIDLGSISLTVPKSMANSLLNTRSISYAGCVIQVFLFIFFTAVDFGFLTIMAYDRYIAICKPLHYETIMNRRACVQMAVSAWITGVLLSTLHTGNTFAITFCGSNTVGQFYCEIPQLLKLSCSDLYLGEAAYNELRKKMSNRTTVIEFLLLGFSDIRTLQVLHFVGFLVMYLVALTGNILIITAVALIHDLHTPMYFFLMNMSLLDLGSISTIVLKSMTNSFMSTRSISYYGCVAQVFLFLFFATTELLY